jgi:hypothetical protein
MVSNLDTNHFARVNIQGCLSSMERAMRYELHFTNAYDALAIFENNIFKTMHWKRYEIIDLNAILYRRNSGFKFCLKQR